MDVIVFCIGVIALFFRRLELALTATILLSTRCFELLGHVSDTIFPHNVYDLSLAMLVLIALWLTTNPERSVKRDDKALHVAYAAILVLLCFVFLTILVDLTCNEESKLVYVVRTSRHWISLCSFGIFWKIENKILLKSIRYCLWISAVVLFLQLLMDVFDITLYKERAIYDGEERGVLPCQIFIFYILLMCMADWWKRHKMFFAAYCALGILVTIYSGTRSILIGTVFAFCVFLLARCSTKKSFIKSLVISICILGSTLFVINNNKLLQNRFDDMKKEIELLDDSIDEPTGTLSLRLNHFVTRQKYVCSNTQRFLFGIGNIIEADFKPVFRDNLVQLDTADISWSGIVLRIGYGGLAIFITTWIVLLTVLFLKRKTSEQSLPLFAFMMSNLVMISFCSSSIATGYFYIFVNLVYVSCFREQTEKGDAADMTPSFQTNIAGIRTS